jgi:hypothetical protein
MCAKKLMDSPLSDKESEKTDAKSEKKAAVTKKKLVVSYKNLDPDIVDLVKEQYPKGYAEHLIKVERGNGQFFYAVTLNTETVDYLIKVDVKIDSEIEEVEKALFDTPDLVDDGFPDTDSFEHDEDDE